MSDKTLKKTGSVERVCEREMLVPYLKASMRRWSTARVRILLDLEGRAEQNVQGGKSIYQDICAWVLIEISFMSKFIQVYIYPLYKKAWLCEINILNSRTKRWLQFHRGSV